MISVNIMIFTRIIIANSKLEIMVSVNIMTLPGFRTPSRNYGFCQHYDPARIPYSTKKLWFISTLVHSQIFRQHYDPARNPYSTKELWFLSTLWPCPDSVPQAGIMVYIHIRAFSDFPSTLWPCPDSVLHKEIMVFASIMTFLDIRQHYDLILGE